MPILNDMQEAFCQAYVANGGHATDAATAAGYAHPRVTGCRLLTNPKVSACIKELLSLGITCRLGELEQEAFGIAMNHEAPTRDRLTAIFSLMDRGGLTYLSERTEGSVGHFKNDPPGVVRQTGSLSGLLCLVPR